LERERRRRGEGGRGGGPAQSRREKGTRSTCANATNLDDGPLCAVHPHRCEPLHTPITCGSEASAIEEQHTPVDCMMVVECIGTASSWLHDHHHYYYHYYY
jgi:hypothetical protein